MIELKIDALQMWNVALAGTASGNLLSLIENAYGYPESRESILWGQVLEGKWQRLLESWAPKESAGV